MTHPPLGPEPFAILWSTGEGSDWVPGLTFYGLVAKGTWQEREFPSAFWGPDVQAHRSSLSGELWEVIIWDAAISSWPPAGNAWRAAVHGTLLELLEGGAVVAWVGLEGHFYDPPDLLIPDMAGGVLAALAIDGTFYCAADPDNTAGHLSDEQMLHLRTVAAGLADAY